MEQMDFDSPVGNLLLTGDGEAVTGLCWREPAGRRSDCPILREAAAQLEAYFRGELQRFDVPLRPAGTAFQQRAWAALLEIPWGETRSYGSQAAAMGMPQAARAVGQANRRNPICIFIPCHRVIGANGALTGYAEGLDRKRFLLALEGILPKEGSS